MALIIWGKHRSAPSSLFSATYHHHLQIHEIVSRRSRLDQPPCLIKKCIGVVVLQIVLWIQSLFRGHLKRFTTHHRSLSVCGPVDAIGANAGSHHPVLRCEVPRNSQSQLLIAPPFTRSADVDRALAKPDEALAPCSFVAG